MPQCIGGCLFLRRSGAKPAETCHINSELRYHARVISAMRKRQAIAQKVSSPDYQG